MTTDPSDVKLAEQQHRLPLEIVEAFKAGTEWVRSKNFMNGLPETFLSMERDEAAKHYAMTGEIQVYADSHD